MFVIVYMEWDYSGYDLMEVYGPYPEKKANKLYEKWVREKRGGQVYELKKLNK